MSNLYVGVDPGANGGLALINDTQVMVLQRMPDTEAGLWHWFRGVRECVECNPHPPGGGRLYAAIERVGGYVGGGGRHRRADGTDPHADTGSSMFAFGQSYGGLRMALVACGLEEDRSFWAVPAITWQRALRVPPTRRATDKRDRARAKREHKAALQLTAVTLFPETPVPVTLKTCDALLLAEYCRRKVAGLY